MLPQAKATNEELAKLGDLLGIPASNLTAEIGEEWFPRRGLGPVPPQDPLLYRLHEVRMQTLLMVLIILNIVSAGCPRVWYSHQGSHSREVRRRYHVYDRLPRQSGPQARP